MKSIRKNPLANFLLPLIALSLIFSPVRAAEPEAYDSPGAAFQEILAGINGAIHTDAPLAISSIQLDESFAIAYLRSTARVPEYPEPAVLLAVADATGGWQAFAPGITPSAEFNQILAGFPLGLVDEDTRNFLSLADRSEMSVQAISGHKLPWQHQTTAVVTQKDGTSHFNQVDFAILNDGVYATKPGIVLYVKESSPDPAAPECINDGVTWKKGNYVVIKHSDLEYTWYYHMTYNSVPVQVGDAVGFGTRLGTEGRTGYTCGPTGIHLHYMASAWAPSTFPDPSIIDAATWPLISSITDVNFTEVSWANLQVGSTYTSQNAGETNPASPLPANAIFCANENAICNFDGIGTVYFGAGDAYVSIPNIKMSTPCTSAVFGDPNPGSVKQCFAAITATAPNCPVVTSTARFFNGVACSGSAIDAGPGLMKFEANNFNDLAESFALPVGWSARLFQNNSEILADSLCLISSDKNLNDNVYQNGKNAGNSVTWVRVYSNNSCGSIVPGSFNKISPATGATGVSTSPTLSWGNSAGVTGYQYCYDTTNDGVCSNWISKGTNPSKTLSGLQPSTTYFWQVRGINGSGVTYANGSEPAYWSFTTGSATDFGKISPANSATGVATSPSLSWAALNGASGYEVCHDSSDDGACSNWISAGTATSLPISGLSPSTPYYWQVRATTTNGVVYANTSTFWSFTTISATPAKPGKPTGLMASDGTYTDKVSLTWDPAASATNYKVFRATSSTLPSTAKAVNITSTTYNDTSATAGTTYTYWVKACNALGCGPVSNPNTGYKQKVGSPDLVIKAITISPLNPALGKDFKVVVKVKNQGVTASPAFRLIFTMDSAPGSCPASGAGYYDISSLAAGTAKDLTFTARFDTGLIHKLYAMADSQCQVAENLETNNLFGPTQVNLISGP